MLSLLINYSERSKVFGWVYEMNFSYELNIEIGRKAQRRIFKSKIRRDKVHKEYSTERG